MGISLRCEFFAVPDKAGQALGAHSYGDFLLAAIQYGLVNKQQQHPKAIQ